jgi:hypothetical protein
MCQRVACSSCGKPSFVGCGRHVEQVLGDVPREARCRCREDKRAGGDASGGQSQSLLERLFGKL